jgi:chemotaxis protein MotB
VQENGLGPQQVTQVRGYADQRLRKPQQPEDPSNRRISLIVQYLTKPEPNEPEGKEPAKEEGKEPEKKH